MSLGRRIELGDELDEGAAERWVVAFGLRSDDLEDLAVAIGGLFFFTARLMHHAEPVPPVVHFGEAFQEIACGGLDLLELAGSDEVGRGVGGSCELLELVGDRGSLGEARKELGALAARCSERRAATRSARAAWSLAMTSRSAASSLG